MPNVFASYTGIRSHYELIHLVLLWVFDLYDPPGYEELSFRVDVSRTVVNPPGQCDS